MSEENSHIFWAKNEDGTKVEYNKEADMVYGTLLLIITLLGTPGNALSLYYFLSKRRDVSAIIYICITGVDTVLCLCALPVALSYFNNRNPTMFNSLIFCNLWHFVFKVLASMSIFCVALLSVTRTFFLLRPFKSISQRLIVAVLGSYFVFQCVAGTVIYWEEGGVWMYHSGYVECSYGEVKKYETVGDVMLSLCMTFPIFPIILSCVISIFALMDSAKEGRTAERCEEKQYASVTIVMFTVLYAVFNIPSCLLNLVNLFNKPLFGKMLAFDTLGYFGNFVWSLSIPLNSFCNPVLYIIRMKNLRAAVFKFVTGKYRKQGADYPGARTEMVRVTISSPSKERPSVDC